MVVRGLTRITRKGQITVPAEIRAALGLKEGDRVQLSYDERTNVVTLEPPSSVVTRTAGMLKRPGQPRASAADERQTARRAWAHAAVERDERSQRGS
jgi:AbrB family looped-hinge helix DNA binding protein